MQPYYTITDIYKALQHAAWGWKLKTPQQQQPQRHYNATDQTVKFGGKRSGYGFNKHHHGGGGGYRGGGGAESMVRNNSETKVASDDKALSVAEEKIGNVNSLLVLAS